MGVLAIALILTAFALKAGRRKFGRPHYAAGLAAFATALTAVAVAFWAVGRLLSERGTTSQLPPTVVLHFAVVSLALLVLVAQVGMGVTMLLFGQTRRTIFRVHRRNARLVLGLSGVVFVLGATSVGLMLLAG